ncbi:MAG: AI-2E family transporter [Planctomycetales bacterium]|nr:AI-2E family transporter [Planctomycetales bacterium]
MSAATKSPPVDTPPEPAERPRAGADSAAPAAHRPDYARRTAWATITLVVLAMLAAAYIARAILFPIALAALLNLALKPIVAGMERRRIPSIAASGLVLAGLIGVFVTAIALLWTPASEWFFELRRPEVRRELAEKLRPLRAPVQQLNQASKEVEKMTSGEGETAPLRVQVEQPGMASLVLNTSGSLLATVVVVAALLFFLLARGDRFLEKLVALSPTWRDKRNVVALMNDIQQSISRYLLTITCINAGLGLAIGIAMWAIGLPNPALWGVMAFLLNYIPFVGAAAGACLVFVVALIEWDVAYALVAPGAYLAVNVVEANLVTPALLGRSTNLNPVAILLSLTLWGWMWGLGGVFLAIPLLVVAKIICEHIEPLHSFGQLIAD